ncbi:MAG: DUF4399 domain-containing protein [Gammaproteobacteria bacterium]|nr:DUF4399 domain-containing protein [Gammaproteobacteria bacterium]
MRKPIVAALSAALIAGAAQAGDTPTPEGAKVYFISPQDGAEVSSPVKVVFGLTGMGVAPAGTVNDKTGHHHLIIDADLPDPDLPIPVSENYRHFGGGQTETMVKLAPGKHTLQLLVGDFKHVPHTEPVASKRITVTVK